MGTDADALQKISRLAIPGRGANSALGNKPVESTPSAGNTNLPTGRTPLDVNAPKGRNEALLVGEGDFYAIAEKYDEVHRHENAALREQLQPG